MIYGRKSNFMVDLDQDKYNNSKPDAVLGIDIQGINDYNIECNMKGT